MAKYVFDHGDFQCLESKLAYLEVLLEDHAGNCKFLVIQRTPYSDNLIFHTDNLTQEEKDALISYLSS